MENGKELQETIGTIDIDNDGDISNQLKDLKNNKINKIDIIDNLESNDKNKVLSANQGKIINNKLNKKTYYFNNVAEMKEAKLKAGDFAITLGYYEANDGGKSLYKIRKKEITDIIDDMFIIGLYDEILIAELILDEELNVLSIGIKNDNQTDNFSILKTALDNYKKNNIILYFPNGVYVFNKSNYYITLPDYTKIKGDNSTIFFNDTNTSGVSLFNGAIKSLTIENLHFNSTFDSINNVSNSALLYYNQDDNAMNCYINNCKFTNFRRNVLEAKNTNKLIITNSIYDNVARDCNRFLNAQYSFVNGNIFNLCGDDVVSCHGNKVNSIHIFSNNEVRYSFGPAYLGGKYIDIHDNKFINPFLIFKCGISESEGSDTEVINFHNNIVLQPLKIAGKTDNRITWIGRGTKNIKINDNEFLDGDLTVIDSVNFVGLNYTNQSISKGQYIISSLDSTYIHNYLQFNNNHCSIRTGPESINLGNTRFMLGKFKNVDMYNNTIENFYSSLITQNSIFKNWNIKNNVFNGDKDHLIALEGKFNSSTELRVLNPYPNNFEDNILMNVSGNYGLPKSNKIYYDPINNKYMNPIDIGQPCEFIPYNYDDNTIYNNIIEKSSNMPTTGYYHAGTYVMSNYTNDSTPIAWYRKTTGNSHVLGADWIPIYPKTTL